MIDRVWARFPLVVLGAALAILFHRLLVGDVLFWGLPALQFVPWRDYGFDLVRHGTLPLWNPFNGAGAPLLANYQSALLYPLNWPGLILPLAWTMSVSAVVHLFLAGWGMWRLTGQLGLPRLGRGVSALAFGMTGYLVARLGTYPTISAAAWLPWLVWAAIGVIERGRRRDFAWLAWFTALLLLAGHAQTAWYSLLLTGVIALVWTLRHPARRTRTPWPRLAFAAGAVLLGAGIASVQLAATAELLGQSPRSDGVTYDYAANFSYAPLRALNWLAPNLFGTPADGSYLTQGAYFEDAVYIGLIPLLGAITAAVAWLRRRRGPAYPALLVTVPLWLGLAIVGFVLALGDHTPIFPFLYEHVPTFALFQAPVRWHLWTVFSLSVLAGIGVTVWGRGERLLFWTRLGTAAGAGAALLAVIVLLSLPEGQDGVSVLLRALIPLGVFAALAGLLTLRRPEPSHRRYGLWSALVLVITAADLALASWGLNPTAPAAFFDRLAGASSLEARAYWPRAAEEAVKYERTFRFDDYRIAAEGWQSVRASGLPNLNLLDRYPLLNQFDPLLIGDFAAYINLIEANPSASENLLTAAGVGAVYEPEGALHQFNQSAARARVVESVCWHENTSDLEVALTDPAWQPETQLHILGDAGCTPVTDARTPVGRVTSLTDAANSVTINVESERDAWLLLADAAYPGWSASIDGQPAPIYRANLAFRAVQIPAGTHSVIFSYQPTWLLPSVFISLLALLGLIVLFRSQNVNDSDAMPTYNQE
jgi:hypothetical protein